MRSLRFLLFIFMLGSVTPGVAQESDTATMADPATASAITAVAGQFNNIYQRWQGKIDSCVLDGITNPATREFFRTRALGDIGQPCVRIQSGDHAGLFDEIDQLKTQYAGIQGRTDPYKRNLCKQINEKIIEFNLAFSNNASMQQDHFICENLWLGLGNGGFSDAIYRQLERNPSEIIAMAEIEDMITALRSGEENDDGLCQEITTRIDVFNARQNAIANLTFTNGQCSAGVPVQAAVSDAELDALRERAIGMNVMELYGAIREISLAIRSDSIAAAQRVDGLNPRTWLVSRENRTVAVRDALARMEKSEAERIIYASALARIVDEWEAASSMAIRLSDCVPANVAITPSPIANRSLANTPANLPSRLSSVEAVFTFTTDMTGVYSQHYFGAGQNDPRTVNMLDDILRNNSLITARLRDLSGSITNNDCLALIIR